MLLLLELQGDVSLDDLLAKGQRVVLAFYFEDGTATCVPFLSKT